MDLPVTGQRGPVPGWLHSGVGILYALLMPLVREPHQRRLNALMVVGAGAAYVSGGGPGALVRAAG